MRTRRQIVLHGVGLAFLAAATGGTAAAAEPKPPIFLVLVVDGLRPDHLGCYGYPGYTSPMIDDLCATGVVFTRAYAQSSWGPASVASLATSTYPSEHGARSGWDTLGADRATVAAVLQAHGYATAAYSADVGSGLHGLLAGFSVADSTNLHTAEQMTWAIGKWIGENRHELRSRGALIYLHYNDVRLGTFPPPAYLRRFIDEPIDHAALDAVTARLRAFALQLDATELARIRPAYDAAIAYLDAGVQQVLADLKHQRLLDRLWIFLLAPHGEAFGEHGLAGHGHTLYEEAIHVPLIIVPPAGHRSGFRYGEVVELIDVAPTLVDLAGLPPEPAFRGRSLRPALAGGRVAKDGAVAELMPAGVLRLHQLAVISPGGCKRIEKADGSFELYDLNEDSSEMRNLSDLQVPGRSWQELSWRELYAVAREGLVSAPCRATVRSRLLERAQELTGD